MMKGKEKMMMTTNKKDWKILVKRRLGDSVG